MAGKNQDVAQRQRQLLAEMEQIRLMRRGSLSRQHYPQREKRQGGQGASGPYFLWQGYVKGQRFGVRVSAQEAPEVASEIEARHRFEDLCAEYVALGEALAEEKRRGAKTKHELKKGLKSRSNRARKSRG